MYLNDPRENSYGYSNSSSAVTCWLEEDNRHENRYQWGAMIVDYCDLPPEEYAQTIFNTGGSEPSSKKYTIVFKNADGTVLQSTKVEEGSTIEYTGATPTKESTDQYDYTFSAWTPELKSGDVASSNKTYTATFSEVERVYDVKVLYLNDEGVGEDGEAVKAEMTLPNISYSDITFENIRDNVGKSGLTLPYANYTWTGGSFTCNTEQEGVANYTASYKIQVYEYLTKFLMDDGTTLIASASTEYRKTVNIPEATKDSTVASGFTFSAWTPELSGTTLIVTESKDYTAVFDSHIRKYDVSFKDEKGNRYDNIGGETEYGSMPNSGDTAPVKYVEPEKEKEYVYDFTGWTPEIHTVDGSGNTYTAQFEKNYIKYCISGVVENCMDITEFIGTVVGEKENYKYGEEAKVTYELFSGITDEVFVKWHDENTDNPRYIIVNENNSYEESGRTIISLTASTAHKATYTALDSLGKESLISIVADGKTYNVEDGLIKITDKFNPGQVVHFEVKTKDDYYIKQIDIMTGSRRETETGNTFDHIVPFLSKDDSGITISIETQKTYSLSGNIMADQSVEVLISGESSARTYTEHTEPIIVDENTECYLTALTSKDYEFDKWNDEILGSNSATTLFVNRDIDLGFSVKEVIKNIHVEVPEEQREMGYLTIAGQGDTKYWTIDSGVTINNKEVAITANTMNSGYTFEGWSDSATTDNYRMFNYDDMTGDVNISAIFKEIPTYRLEIVGDSGITGFYPNNPTGDYLSGTQIAVEAEWDSSIYEFDKWSDGYNYKNRDITISGDTYLSALTKQVKFMVEFNDYDDELLQSGYTSNGEKPIAPADPTRETTSAATYTFIGWNPDITEVSDSAQSYTAVYKAEEQLYTVRFHYLGNKDQYENTYSQTGVKWSDAGNPNKLGKYIMFNVERPDGTYYFQHWDGGFVEGEYLAEYTAVYEKNEITESRVYVDFNNIASTVTYNNVEHTSNFNIYEAEGTNVIISSDDVKGVVGYGTVSASTIASSTNVPTISYCGISLSGDSGVIGFTVNGEEYDSNKKSVFLKGTSGVTISATLEDGKAVDKWVISEQENVNSAITINVENTISILLYTKEKENKVNVDFNGVVDSVTYDTTTYDGNFSITGNVGDNIKLSNIQAKTGYKPISATETVTIEEGEKTVKFYSLGISSDTNITSISVFGGMPYSDKEKPVIFGEKTNVSLAATAKDGYVVNEWREGEDLLGTGASININIDHNTEIIVTSIENTPTVDYLYYGGMTDKEIKNFNG